MITQMKEQFGQLIKVVEVVRGHYQFKKEEMIVKMIEMQIERFTLATYHIQLIKDNLKKLLKFSDLYCMWN